MPVRDLERDPRYRLNVERAKGAIALRLERVCTHMPKHEFDALVEQIASVEVKYRMLNDGPPLMSHDGDGDGGGPPRKR